MVFEREAHPAYRNADFIQISDKESPSDYLFPEIEDLSNESISKPMSTEEMEQIILIHPAVERAVVVRSKGQFRAFVVLRRGYQDEKPEDIKSFVDDQVGFENHLRGGLYIMPNLAEISRKNNPRGDEYQNKDANNLELPAPAAAA